MNRRSFLKTSGAAIPAMAAGAGFFCAKGKRPSIILCMADDQGWGDMAYNGHPHLKTPCFDEAAAAGLRFDRFYAAAPVCSPTRGSVMTGRHPNRFGCFRWGHPLRPQEITIAEVLKKAGYATGHFGKWHLGSVRSGSPVNPGASGFDEWFSGENFFDIDPVLSDEGKAVQATGESSMITVDRALEFIREHAGYARPFFAVVWFGSPHRPHRAPDEDLALYAEHPPERAHFYGEITAMDRAFGKMRSELRTLGIHENTLLWYCSDNGGLPDVGSTGGRGNKSQIYEGGLRVPAFLEWPARTVPGTTELPCVTSDIFPTLLEITGLRAPDDRPMDGVSLLPLVSGGMDNRPGIGFWDYPEPGIPTPNHVWMPELLEEQKAGRNGDPSRLRPDAGNIDKQYPEDRFPGHAAWLEWPWKLHRMEKKENGIVWELYHLGDDPMETRNLITEGSEKKADELRPHLETWLLSVVRSLNGKDYGG